VAAERAELQEFSSASTQACDTIVAKNLQTMGALMGCLGFGMTWAEQGTIPQDNGRRLRLDDFKPRDGYGYFGRLDKKFDVTQTKCLSGGKPGFFDGFAADERAIRGIAIL